MSRSNCIFKWVSFLYLITSKSCIIGNPVYSGYIDKYSTIEDCWAVPVKNLNLFSVISNIEIRIGKGFKIARAAGVSGLLVAKTLTNAYIKLNSSWQIETPLNAFAVKGIISNSNYKFRFLGKAGSARALGFKSKVRGVAKNPCDHPHGGGNGKKAKPVNPVNALGKYTVGTPTNNTKVARLNRRLFKKI